MSIVGCDRQKETVETELTMCPKWTLVKLNILRAALESLMDGWIFSLRNFSMYIPKKGQAWSSTCTGDNGGAV